MQNGHTPMSKTDVRLPVLPHSLGIRAAMRQRSRRRIEQIRNESFRNNRQCRHIGELGCAGSCTKSF